MHVLLYLSTSVYVCHQYLPDLACAYVCIFYYVCLYANTYLAPIYEYIYVKQLPKNVCKSCFYNGNFLYLPTAVEIKPTTDFFRFFSA